LRKRVIRFQFHAGLLHVVNIYVRGCRKCYMEQTFFARLLTSAFCFGYHSLVAAKSATGLGRSNPRRTHRQLFIFGGFFVSICMALLLFWAGHAGSRKARRPLDRSTNPHGSALFAFGRAGRGYLKVLSKGAIL
jgi:hypothetical protein